MPAIHVIHKDDRSLPQITPITPGANVYRSGNWVVSEESAAGLVGGKIYFHRAKAKPSFFGGKITDFEKIPDGEAAGRVIFTFEFEEGCRGVKTLPEGWGQEKKFDG
jgi:hypothetical protein